MSGSDTRPAVLYVDDDAINLRVFDANFRSRFRVLIAASGQEALEILRRQSEEIAVLISDQRMPGMTGVELLERARELAPDVRRMLITAYSDIQAVMDAVNRGQVVRYFVKPWAKEELSAAIQDAIGIFELQSKVRSIEVRMLQSERLAALGQVSAGIAHELMNPVAYVTQNVVTLRQELQRIEAWIAPRLAQAPDTELQQTLEELPAILNDIQSGVKHIRQVALNVRSQARGEDLEESCELSSVLGFAVKIARAEVRSRVRIQVEGAPVTVGIGPVKLSQVLINLMVNAAQAMPEREELGEISVRWATDGDRVRVEIKDNGTGIPEALLERVFEPLFTTKPVGTGTGLGLPICRDILREVGGDIRLQSVQGVGTTALVTLPLA